jgi:hypothetical protein
VPIVPDVSGLGPARAFDTIRAAGLQPALLGLPTRKSDGDLAYLAAAQEPAAGASVVEGDRVLIAFGTGLQSLGTIAGPPVAAIGTPAPSVLGVDLEAAITAVTDLGLIAVVFQPERAVSELAISRQEPEPGLPTGPFREVALWID